MTTTSPTEDLRRQREQEVEVLVSIRDAGKILKLTPWTILRLCDQGKLRTSYHGERRMVSCWSILDDARSLPSEPKAAPIT